MKQSNWVKISPMVLNQNQEPEETDATTLKRGNMSPSLLDEDTELTSETQNTK